LDKIILYVRPENVINGILFYCVEHFLYLSEYTDIDFCVIFDGDINYIKDIIKEKYVIGTELNNIKQIKTLDLIKTDTDKALVLDTDTYNAIKPFNKKIKKIFLYSNDNNHNARAQDNVYGFYNYQKFHIKERLKLGLQFMKPVKQTIDKTFCSHYITGAKLNKQLIEKVSAFDVVYKSFTKDLNILNFKEIVYYHRGEIDRNNRIIVEANYFKIPIILLNVEGTNDSVNERYNTCLYDGCEKFIINKEYKIIADFISLKV
jgi:hypothetical protein